MTLRMGELFAGYGGLGLGVQAAIPDVELAWYSDVCRFGKDGTVGHHDPHRGACAIMAHHHPDVPNLGDVSAVDWSSVEPVDILTGGSPCQDLSHAGKRAGMTEGTRSNLWVAMREAIAQLRPGLVVWENVRGAYSAEADSDVEQCEGCLGDRSGQPVLRALGRVLGDLSDLGYVGGWHGIRAANVGAPHGRFRVFVVAADAQRGGWDGRSSDALGRPLQRVAPARGGEGPGPLLPTPATSDTNGPGAHGDGGLDLRTAVSLLGTPRASEHKGSGPVGSKSHAHMEARDYLSAQVLSLLPTPRTANNENRQSEGYGGGKDGNFYELVRGTSDWGAYAPAIARWEHFLGRTAPAPTQTSSNGNPQLSPAFVEWMMGLPAGHVTDIPGLSRNDRLKALGNGCVPLQVEAAIRFLLPII